MKYLIAFLIVFPFIAVADPIAIRSGEHDTFSRLVLTIDRGADWGVIPVDGGFEVTFQNHDDGFDISNVFDRIPRDRLGDVVQTASNTLLLRTDCACPFDTFLYRPDQLVVDILDAPEPDPRAAQTRDTILLLGTPASPTGPLTLPNMLVLDPDGAGSQRFAVIDLPPAPDVNPLAETEAALSEGIARAATQGFLEPAIAPAPPAPIVQATPPKNSVDDPRYTLPRSDRRPGIGISTAMERDLATLGDTLTKLTQDQCAPADLFDIANWGSSQAIHTQIAALAEDLSGEFGEEPRSAQERLARVYVHFGFGVEARAALASDPASSLSRQILIELAGVIDGYDEPYPAIRLQHECATGGRLWAFLVDAQKRDAEDRDQIILAFFQLPQPLRGQISPRLAQRFIDIGDPEGARQVLGAASATDAALSHEVHAAQAEVSIKINEEEDAIRLLTREAEDNARTTPSSLIRLIELQLSRSVAPSVRDLDLAASMQMEHADTAVALDLANAEARGRVALSQYEAALEIFQGREDENARAIINETYRAITDAAPTTTFLNFAFLDRPELLDPATENAIAKRLIAIGFPERAAVLLDGPAQREDASERRYLRAEAAYAQDDHLAVLENILGMTDDRARDLRARAHAALGQYGEALSARAFDEDNTRSTLQFRANAWERLAEEGDEVLSGFAQVASNPGATNPARSLADRREILAQSEQSRRAIEDLLSQYDGVAATE